MRFTVRQISPHETLPLRQEVLRPGQPLNELLFPGDLDSTSLHVGGYAKFPDVASEMLVGVASVYCQDLEGAMSKGLANLAGSGAWRLRGMATHPRVRGSGLGAQLLLACIEHARAEDGDVMWCNARVPAAGFYMRFGFEVHGREFELPKIGPHYLMSKNLLASPRPDMLDP